MDDTSKISPAAYPFRFGASGNTIHLTQDQLDHFPYLVALVVHTDDFVSAQNEHGEYLLNDPISYDSFIVIFRSIIQNQPHVLLTELSHDINVLSVLQLYDYLCIKPLALPILKEKKLVRLQPSSTGDELNDVEFRRATLLKARNQAAQLIVAISKDAYGLNDKQTRANLFALLQSIFTSPEVFNSKFRFHALTIVKKYCSSWFSAWQLQQLPTIGQVTRHSQVDSWMYQSDDDHSLLENFTNSLAWKDCPSCQTKCEAALLLRQCPIGLSGITAVGKSTLLTTLSEYSWTPLSLRAIDAVYYVRPYIMENRFYPARWVRRLCTLRVRNWPHDNEVSDVFERNKEEKKYEEAQSARSGRFNTLPKRPEVDRFKHRSGPKARKHR